MKRDFIFINSKTLSLNEKLLKTDIEQRKKKLHSEKWPGLKVSSKYIQEYIYNAKVKGNDLRKGQVQAASWGDRVSE